MLSYKDCVVRNTGIRVACSTDIVLCGVMYASILIRLRVYYGIIILCSIIESMGIEGTH